MLNVKFERRTFRVIPAKAGIQFISHISSLPLRLWLMGWIPAFAGMTALVEVVRFYGLKR